LRTLPMSACKQSGDGQRDDLRSRALWRWRCLPCIRHNRRPHPTPHGRSPNDGVPQTTKGCNHDIAGFRCHHPVLGDGGCRDVGGVLVLADAIALMPGAAQRLPCRAQGARSSKVGVVIPKKCPWPTHSRPAAPNLTQPRPLHCEQAHRMPRKPFLPHHRLHRGRSIR
jgi:hypothetical protein